MMYMRIRLLAANGSVLEDHDVPLSESTQKLLAGHRNASICPTLTVEFTYTPGKALSSEIFPGMCHE